MAQVPQRISIVSPYAIEAAWLPYWDKYRARTLQAAGVLLFLIAKPRSNFLFGLGVLLIAGGETLRAWTLGHIQKGRPLFTDGPYRLVRHPLHAGSLAVCCGFVLLSSSFRHWFSTLLLWGVLAAVFNWYYQEKILMEEHELLSRFPEEFGRYRHSVPRLRPNWKRWRQAWETSQWQPQLFLQHREQKTIWAILGLLFFLRFKMVYFR